MSVTHLQNVQSMINIYPDSDHVFGAYVESGLIFVYSALAICGLTVNLILLFVTLKTQDLRVPTNSLLLNLIVADLTLCLISIPFTLWSITRKSWPFGSTACNFILVFQGMAIFGASTTITMISFERLLRVTRNTGNKLMTKKGLILSIACIWLFSGIMSTPLIVDEIPQLETSSDHFSYVTCLEEWPYHVKGWYTAIILGFQLLTPVFVLSITYFRINAYLKAHLSSSEAHVLQNLRPKPEDTLDTELNEQIDGRLPAPSTRQFKDNPFRDDNRQPRHVVKELVRNARVVKALLVLSVTFAFSWFPWNAFNLYLDFSGAAGLKPETIYMVIACCHIIAMTSTISNAFLYGWCNASVKEGIDALKARLTACFRSTPEAEAEADPESL